MYQECREGIFFLSAQGQLLPGASSVKFSAEGRFFSTFLLRLREYLCSCRTVNKGFEESMICECFYSGMFLAAWGAFTERLRFCMDLFHGEDQELFVEQNDR